MVEDLLEKKKEIQREVFRKISLFDHAVRSFVLSETNDSRCILANSIKSKLSVTLKKAEVSALISSDESSKVRKLFFLLHDFLHADFQSFLTESRLLKNSGGVLISTILNQNGEVDSLPLADAEDKEIYAWLVVLTQNASFVIKGVDEAIGILKKVKEFTISFSLTTPMPPDDPIAIYMKKNNLGDGSDSIRMYPVANYLNCMTKGVEFEINLRLLATNSGLKGFGNNLSDIVDGLKKSYQPYNLDAFDKAILLRNQIVHFRISKEDRINFVRIGSVIDELKKSNNFISDPKTFGAAVNKNSAEFYRNRPPELMPLSDPLSEWISDMNGFGVAELFFDSALFLIDHLLTEKAITSL